ncbi:hypothetical protein DEU56DRAFT_461733 [Suillus clintonianus]|uniref:uncharacterized protein n=1 Tax=Suillus clintonianus TaxID=1904413 RepID=UPI001B881D93|nr:uncharacterized protein DEU56DRAFT_461733 [Suillus clintonianus]KAG2130862.1 hypothetical protein DEU56DRAFT_461733 [Suillus clintonianus]
MSTPLLTFSEPSVEILLRSFMTIILSEIGDKTFFIAAILSMRHPRFVVFLGAFASLFLMSMLSASLGHILPTLLPKKWTQIMAGVLFLVFGSKMVMEGREMEGKGNEKAQEEMREAEEEIEGDEFEAGDGIPLERIEEGEAVPSSPSARKQKSFGWGIAEGVRNFCSLILGPVFVQAFVLTFLGEWGDRSQIATIALGAAHNVYLVTLGTVVGHTCCTALAVVGGRYVSSKISVKHVTLGGAALFLIFGVIYLYDALATSAEEFSIPISPAGES